MIQSGDGDWIINTIASRIELRFFLTAMVQVSIPALKDRSLFIWRYLPPNKELLLCVSAVKISILDKNGVSAKREDCCVY
jgi:hypothetical protein